LITKRSATSVYLRAAAAKIFESPKTCLSSELTSGPDFAKQYAGMRGVTVVMVAGFQKGADGADAGPRERDPEALQSCYTSRTDRGL